MFCNFYIIFILLYAAIIAALLPGIGKAWRRTLPDLDTWPDISIIVPVRDGEGTIRQCLNALMVQDYPGKKLEILVVDDHSRDHSLEIIGKLASQFRAAGKSVIIAAGDTFRAAAVEQLQVWGERAGVPVLTAPEGSDPASLAFDAMTRAEAEGADLLLIDTAGRLQNRTDLMEELAKIVRVIRKKDDSAPHNTLLVLDATTGQNAVNQVDTFQKISDVSGLVMTKLDGTARAGVLVALADKFGLPIHAIGVGEQIDDLAPFDPKDFAKALTGLDD